jgi:hypothetical protein
MNIAIDGSNFFHTGWAARLVGLPRDNPCAASLRDSDAAAFREGWDTCDETFFGPRSCLAIIEAMKSRGQLVSYWQDEDGSEIV